MLDEISDRHLELKDIRLSHSKKKFRAKEKLRQAEVTKIKIGFQTQRLFSVWW